jgi:hypothetical protein
MKLFNITATYQRGFSIQNVARAKNLQDLENRFNLKKRFQPAILNSKPVSVKVLEGKKIVHEINYQ